MLMVLEAFDQSAAQVHVAPFTRVVGHLHCAVTTDHRDSRRAEGITLRTRSREVSRSFPPFSLCFSLFSRFPRQHAFLPRERAAPPNSGDSPLCRENASPNVSSEPLEKWSDPRLRREFLPPRRSARLLREISLRVWSIDDSFSRAG